MGKELNKGFKWDVQMMKRRNFIVKELHELWLEYKKDGKIFWPEVYDFSPEEL